MVKKIGLYLAKRKNILRLSILVIVALGSLCSIIVSESQFKKTILINEILSSNTKTNLSSDYNEFSDWVELHNPTKMPIDISEFYLSNDIKSLKKWKIPSGTVIQPNGYKLIWVDTKNKGYHASFKLKSLGCIYLSTIDVILIDSLAYGNQYPDISYGISETELVYFNTPTPGKLNDIGSSIDNPIKSKLPNFSITGGFYEEAFTIKLSNDDKDTKIYYTLNGNNPKPENWNLYANPLKINKTTIVRAITYCKGKINSDVVTHSYSVNTSHTLPVISLVTDSSHLWDDYTGIYTIGKNGVPGEIGPVANWNHDWERTAAIEYYDAKGTLGFKAANGIKILGLYISAYPQKPIGIYFRGKYGAKKINYQVFEDKEIMEFSHFVIRVGDWLKTGIRDGLMTSLLIGEMDIDYQAYKPVVCYLNGEYWGVYNLREKQNKNYLLTNHPGDFNTLDLIEYKIGHVESLEGDWQEYIAFMNFVNNNDFYDSTNYAKLDSLMDINEFINYQIAEIYFANHDWPGNNLKCWRPKKTDGKWRWILFDLDAGFDPWGTDWYDLNTLEWASANKGISARHNPLYATRLFRKLLQNATFKHEFIQRTATYLNSTFKRERVVHYIDSLAMAVEPEMQSHIDRWGNTSVEQKGKTYVPYNSLVEWHNNLNVMRRFAELRPNILLGHYQQKFQLGKLTSISVNTSNSKYGKIEVSGVSFEENYSGECFTGIPIRIEAIPSEGYKFVKWKGINADLGRTKIIFLTIQESTSITALFEKNK